MMELLVGILPLNSNLKSVVSTCIRCRSSDVVFSASSPRRTSDVRGQHFADFNLNRSLPAVEKHRLGSRSTQPSYCTMSAMLSSALYLTRSTRRTSSTL